MTTASTIADEICWQASERGVSVTPLKLQKLLFLVQAAHLRTRGTVVFTEPVEAWSMGPVVRAVYEVYQGRRTALPKPPRQPRTTATARAAVAEVLTRHGSASANELVRLTHAPDGPWRTTPQRGVIPPEAIMVWSKRVTAPQRTVTVARSRPARASEFTITRVQANGQWWTLSPPLVLRPYQKDGLWLVADPLLCGEEYAESRTAVQRQARLGLSSSISAFALSSDPLAPSAVRLRKQLRARIGLP